MFTAEQFRARAAESAESTQTYGCSEPTSANCSDRSSASASLAQNEDWLANNFDKMIASQDVLSGDDVVRPAPRPATLSQRPRSIFFAASGRL